MKTATKTRIKTDDKRSVALIERHIEKVDDNLAKAKAMVKHESAARNILDDVAKAEQAAEQFKSTLGRFASVRSGWASLEQRLKTEASELTTKAEDVINAGALAIANAKAELKRLKEQRKQRLAFNKRLAKAYGKPNLAADEIEYLQLLAGIENSKTQYRDGDSFAVNAMRQDILSRNIEDFNRWREENEVAQLIAYDVVEVFGGRFGTTHGGVVYRQTNDIIPNRDFGTVEAIDIAANPFRFPFSVGMFGDYAEGVGGVRDTIHCVHSGGKQHIKARGDVIMMPSDDED